MSQFLNTKKNYLSNLNPVVSWKGKTFTQITTTIKNNPGNTVGNPIKTPYYKKGKQLGTVTYQPNLFLPNSLKIYRREIANNIDMTNCYPRTSSSIDEFNRPGGSIVNTSSSTNKNGLVNTLDNILPNNRCEEPGTCSTFLSPSENAKRRCRSSGIISKKNNSTNNYATYYTNSNQYLVSRNKTFLQNQYNFIRVGDPVLKPGPGLAAYNVYSPNGLPVCSKYVIPSDSSFSYQWVDGLYYNVSVPKKTDGYTANDFNSVLQFAMAQNFHFVIDNTTGAKVFLLAIVFNNYNNVFEFQCKAYDEINFPASNFSSDIRASKNWTRHEIGTAISPPPRGSGSSLIPGFKFTNTILAPILGLNSISFPLFIPSQPITSTNINTGTNTQTYSGNQVVTSTTTPLLQFIYKQIYYKPNNSQFAQQGAVSSSSLINRVKYNTINTAAYKTSGNIFGKNATTTYGGSISSALSYGVSENPYTMKNKIGFPNRSYPSFLPNSNIQRNCMETSIPGGVKFKA